MGRTARCDRPGACSVVPAPVRTEVVDILTAPPAPARPGSAARRVGPLRRSSAACRRVPGAGRPVGASAAGPGVRTRIGGAHDGRRAGWTDGGQPGGHRLGRARSATARPSPGDPPGLALETCEEVLAFAFETAARRGAPLTAVHSWEPPAGAEYMHFGAIGGLEELAAAAAQALEAAVAPWRERYPDVPAATALLHGRAGVTMVEAAANAGLAVVGARRRHNPVGAHLGPVAHALIHHVACPVAVVPCR
ncbi:universal stress protein [Kitasatospora sp. NPDC087314]|uniref:universal stress protein n=1 Tax=Kitasatospora sp. NPDC087314 TaxID=3364068 RepID=UPI0038210D44